ncbi:UvrD-helicase domain-containing protein [Sporanaerobacter acetigenes]|uniref:DNA 3'-5' helicase n=1 Tax=Sporanaerobacter acetigenes DSM 13106 TaxID=1123281 RepID=A0A1M5WKS7_9FIRM|nr:UvrD-helicase domain-containing protein [Sporanaerobacter acetigenes]SHH88048.1 ATP-dependent exoDNAse (exonuclease V) beta subunit (contains helicase and exonuclease domains) [Sporanaerobacter acetigenes DSM 13106]
MKGKVELNKNQKRAVETIDKNVAVNAGAGSGKTRVLVERYLYILENGDLDEESEIESILAITFTKKASQEMKERIRKNIKEKFPLDPKWRRMYRDLEKGSISTIHSFCSKILKENPIEANIDPQFKVLEDHESDEILYEVVKEIILKGINSNEKVYELIKNFNVYNLDNFIYTMMNLYKKIRSTGMSFEEVREITLNNMQSFEFNEEDIFHMVDEFKYLMSKSRKNSKLYKLKEDPIWLEFNERDSYDESVLDVLPYLKDNIGTMSSEEDRVSALMETIDKVLKVIEKDKIEFYETLIDLLVQMDLEFSKIKSSLGYLDYEDLQIKVLHLLDIDEIRKEYQRKYKYIMIDEFQDTNELQRQIVYKLASENSKLDRQNLFIVGDPKQSIYAFRGADVEVFHDVIDDIMEVSKIEAINLKDNYRSMNTVLEFVNCIFEKVMKEKYEPLDSIFKSPNNVDVEILENENLEVPNGENPGEFNKYYESRLIAKRIKALVDSGEYKYGDFALLFRSSTEDYIYEEALREYGIPYYNFGGKGFFRQEEIVDLLNGIKGISNIYDTISLVGVLRSPMFGLSDKTIYWLLREKEESILYALNSNIPYIEDRELKKVQRAKEILNLMIVKRDLLNVYNLLNELLKKTYYNEVLMLMYGGKQRVANVYKFLEMARTYTEEENGTISDFINYIEELKLKEIDESQAKIESEDGDSVKLMTIHKSKGLEFKVVIVPQMAKNFNTDKSQILFDKDIGLGIKYEGVSPLYDEINAVLKEKEEEENKRILYVAMTRAEERLILGNQGKKSGFKKFITDFLDFASYELIEDLDVKEEAVEEIRTLEGITNESKPFNENIFPILGGIKGFNQRQFNTYSISQYLIFKECKRKFFMTYYRRLPIDEYEEFQLTNRKSINPVVRGEIVHKFCELYRNGENSAKLLRNIVQSFGIMPTEELAQEFSPYIHNYIANYSENYDKIYSEKKFYYNLPSGIIYGIVDRIYISGNNIEIVDFKTNKVKDKDSLIKKYSPQIQLYTKVCENLYGLKANRASLFLLETGEIVDVDISDEILNKNLKDIENFMEFVCHNNDIKQYERGEICNSYCNFNVICNE